MSFDELCAYSVYLESVALHHVGLKTVKPKVEALTALPSHIRQDGAM